MDILPYIISFGIGFGIGIWFESRYGAKASQVNSEIHAKLDEIKSAMTNKQ